MVTKTTSELQDEEVAEETETTEEVEEVEAETEETESQEQEPDPLAELEKRLGSVEETAQRLAGLDPSKINPAIGRISGMQSLLDEVKAADPLAAADPRFTANEALLSTLATALIGADDELVNAQSKAALRTALDDLGVARTQRDRVVERAEIIAELRAEPSSDTETETAPVAPETREVMGYAEAKGVEPSSIPATAWALAEGETLAQAVKRVKGIVDSLAEESTSVDRVATRRRAAGPGTPSSSGAAMNDEQLVDDFGAHPEKYPTKKDRGGVYAAIERLGY